jgi:conjugative transposon TraN protein
MKKINKAKEFFSKNSCKIMSVLFAFCSLLLVANPAKANQQTHQVATIQSRNTNTSVQTSSTQMVQVEQQQPRLRLRPQPITPIIATDTVTVKDTIFIRDTVPMYMMDSLDIVRFKKLENRTNLFQGLTRKIPYQRMIPPYGLEVTSQKTVHVIFPSPIVYVDLGSDKIIAAKAGSAENVLRVKSAEQYFFEETNMSVITANGSFYTFNVKFAVEPEKLNIEMQNFLHDGSVVNRPNNSMDIFLTELQNETPAMVQMIMKTIYHQNARPVRHIGSRAFGVQFLLKGIYSHNGMLYFFTELRNTTNVPYHIDYLTMKIVDKNLVQRTTIQETVIRAVRAYNHVTSVGARSVERTVFAVPIFTIPQEKKLVFELGEKHGGRGQLFEVDNTDLVRARIVTDFTILWR